MSNESIRVLVLSATLAPVNGWGNLTYELCKEFWSRNDINFDLYVPRSASLVEDLPFASHVHRVLPEWFPSFGRRPWRLLSQFGLQLSVSHDVIHTIVEFPYGILTDALSKRSGMPYIISTQGTYAVVPFRRWLDGIAFRWAVRGASYVTAPSEFTATSLKKASGINRDVRIIHNPINYERFQQPIDSNQVRRQFGIPQEGRLILGVGGLKGRKGFDVLIRAFAEVVKVEPDAWLLIAGEGSSRASLSALAGSLGVAERVLLPGVVKGMNLAGLYQTCDVYAHLPRNSNDFFEGFGIVYLEAGACGKPVVATRSGGVADAVKDGETGFLVDEEDWQSAAKAILRLLHNENLARRIGQAGRRYAQARTWEWYADEMIKLYQSSVNNKK